MSIKNTKDFWSGVMFVLLGVFFVVYAQEHSIGSAQRMGPAYFPTLLCTLMALIGQVIAVRGVLRSNPEDPDNGRIQRFHLRILLLILGSVLLFSLMLASCGLMLSLAAMIVVASLAYHEFRWKETVVLIIVLDVISYVAFIYGIGMIVPVWPSFLQ